MPLVSSSSQYFPRYSSWLSHNLPDWASFKIVTHAEYLRFEIGPTAGSAQYDKVMASFYHHLSVITASGVPPSVSGFYSSCENVVQIFF